MPASDHTRLINKLIGLCRDTVKWPKTLFDLGYDVQLIEQTISLKSAQKVSPDVVAVSGRLLHAIVADCKSGDNIDNGQDARYQELESDDLRHWVTVHDTNQLKHVVCYVDNDTNHAGLEPHTGFPFITFGQDEIRGQGDFGIRQLNEKLCEPVSLEGMREPTGYYPFSPDDEDYVIAPHILRGLMSYLTRRGHKTRPKIKDPATPTEILKLMHPHDLISSRHSGSLTKKIEVMINIFMRCRKFREQVLKIEKGDHSTPTLRSLDKICEVLITEYESQKKITDAF